MEFNLKNLKGKKVHHFNIVCGGQLNDVTCAVSSLLDFNFKNNKNYFYKKYQNLQIDQAREIIQIQNLKHRTSDKLVIMVECDSINHFAQNSLLKILEESPENNYLFLLIPEFENLLPTFLSRAEIFRNTDQRQVITNLNYPTFKLLTVGKRLDTISKILADLGKDKASKNQIIYSVQEIIKQFKREVLENNLDKTRELKSLINLSTHLNDNGAHLKSILELMAIVI